MVAFDATFVYRESTPGIDLEFGPAGRRRFLQEGRLFRRGLLQCTVFAPMRRMPPAAKSDPQAYIGRSVDRLSLEEREALAGKFIAREIYSPKTLPLQRIEAIGETLEQCVDILRRRSLDPMKYEFVRLNPPY